MTPRLSPPNWLAVLLVAALPACSGSSKLNPVQGKVTYKGEPLAGALVTLHPKGTDNKALPSTGFTDKDGTFTVTTGPDKGAPEGDYLVTVICSVKPDNVKQVGLSTGGDADTVDRLRGVYANRDTSRIAVTIKSGKNQLDPFDLK